MSYSKYIDEYLGVMAVDKFTYGFYDYLMHSFKRKPKSSIESL